MPLACSPGISKKPAYTVTEFWTFKSNNTQIIELPSPHIGGRCDHYAILPFRGHAIFCGQGELNRYTGEVREKMPGLRGTTPVKETSVPKVWSIDMFSHDRRAPLCPRQSGTTQAIKKKKSKPYNTIAEGWNLHGPHYTRHHLLPPCEPYPDTLRARYSCNNQ